MASKLIEMMDSHKNSQQIDTVSFWLNFIRAEIWRLADWLV